MNNDPFHESKEALATVKREYTAVSSLNTSVSYTANHACEMAVTTLYKQATGEGFPYQDYPRHKPKQWLDSLDITSYYTPETRCFLNKLDGYSLDKVRFRDSSAYKQHVSNNSSNRAGILATGTERFISETENLSNNNSVVAKLNETILSK